MASVMRLNSLSQCGHPHTFSSGSGSSAGALLHGLPGTHSSSSSSRTVLEHRFAKCPLSPHLKHLSLPLRNSRSSTALVASSRTMVVYAPPRTLSTPYFFMRSLVVLVSSCPSFRARNSIILVGLNFLVHAAPVPAMCSLYLSEGRVVLPQ